MTATLFFSCTNNSENDSEINDSTEVGTDPAYMPPVENSPSNGMNDTAAYGTADSARR